MVSPWKSECKKNEFVFRSSLLFHSYVCVYVAVVCIVSMYWCSGLIIKLELNWNCV